MDFYTNVIQRGNSLLVRGVEDGQRVSKRVNYRPTLYNKVNEYIMTSLRTSWGCDMMYLKKEFEYDILNINETYLQKYTMDDLLIENNNILTLTRKGKFIADEIASQLFI